MAPAARPVMLPDFVIIGAQKSGSTFFLRCLAEHPGVFMPPGEVRFFEDPDYGAGDTRPLEALFQGAAAECVLGIKRPGYLARPEVAGRIHRHIPTARLIAVLRNPVDRAISAYFHLMRSGFIPVRDLEDGMARILDGRYQTAHTKATEVLDFGFYHRHLSRYLEYFDRSQLLIELFDAIRADPLGAVHRAYRFVGVDATYMPRTLADLGQANPNPGVYSLPRLRLLNLRNPFRYAYDEQRTRRYPKRTRSVVDRAAVKVVDTADRHLMARVYGTARPEASDGLRQRLYELYADDIGRLEGLLGRSLDDWKLGVAPQ